MLSLGCIDLSSFTLAQINWDNLEGEKEFYGLSQQFRTKIIKSLCQYFQH